VRIKPRQVRTEKASKRQLTNDEESTLRKNSQNTFLSHCPPFSDCGYPANYGNVSFLHLRGPVLPNGLKSPKCRPTKEQQLDERSERLRTSRGRLTRDHPTSAARVCRSTDETGAQTDNKHHVRRSATSLLPSTTERTKPKTNDNTGR